MKYQYKKAGIYTDMLKAYALPSIPATAPYAALPNTIGTAIGVASDEPVDIKGKELYKWLPGTSAAGIVGQRRMLSRQYGSKNDRATAASEIYGNTTSLIAATLLGAAIGAGVGAKAGVDAKGGALFGSMAGLTAGGSAMLLGSLLAAVRRTRTKEEQTAYEKNPTLTANYLVPGMGAYNQFKAYGRLHNDQVEAEKSSDKDGDESTSK